MKRFNLYLKDEQMEFFKHKEGKIAENIRKAIDEVMKEYEKNSVSASKSKEGGKNG